MAGSPDQQTYLYLDGVGSRDLALALLSSGRVLRRTTVAGGTRTEQLIPAVAGFLARRRPAGIIVAQGGGSFSQSRLAVAVANALAYAWDVRLAVVERGQSSGALLRQLRTLRWVRGLQPRYSAARPWAGGPARAGSRSSSFSLRWPPLAYSPPSLSLR